MSEHEKREEKQLMSIGKIVSWYWKVVGKYRWRFLGGIFSYGIAMVLGGVVPPILYKHIIDTISNGGDVWRWVSILGGCFLASFSLYRTGDFLYFFAQSRALRDIACFTFDRLQFFSYQFFSNRFAGSLVSQSRRYVDAFWALLDTFTFNIWTSILYLLGAFISIFFFSPFLAATFFIGVVTIIIVSLPLLLRRRFFDALESEEDSKVTGRLADVITNILAVKVFSAGNREGASFREFADRQEYARSNSMQSVIFLMMTLSGLSLLFQFSGTAISVWLWSHGKISVGTIVLVQYYLIGVFSLMHQLIRSISEILRSSARASEMIEIFETPIDILDPEMPEEDRIKDGRIEFQNVSFKYADGENVFADFSLAIGDGEKVGLVGPSGAGKTTVTKLLLRFADPQAGEITIDGQDIRNIRQDELRKHIAYVPQDPLLFHRSIRENIAYGKPDATDEEVIAAAKKAEAHSFIERLPAGYETLVGERGVKLSGGERQRVAIARAILKDAEILVLDEATSSLDSESEHAIQEALDDLMSGKTAVVIAHRLSTIRKLDRIVVLNKDGAIEEEGKHDELLAKNGLYASLWNRQTGSFLDEGEGE